MKLNKLRAQQSILLVIISNFFIALTAAEELTSCDQYVSDPLVMELTEASNLKSITLDSSYYCGERIVSTELNLDGSFSLMARLEDQYLAHHIELKSGSISITSMSEPFPEVSIAQGYTQGTKFYVTSDQRFYLYDSDTSAWRDVSSAYPLTEGVIESAYPIGTDFLVSQSGEYAGVWLTGGGTVTQISSNKEDIGSLYFSSVGIFIISKGEDEVFGATNVNTGDRYLFDQTTLDRMGVVEDESHVVIFGRSENKETVHLIDKETASSKILLNPILTKRLLNCFSDAGKIYCVFQMNNGLVNIYDVVNGNYVLDATYLYGGYDIQKNRLYGFKAVGNSRYLLILENDDENSVSYSKLVEVNQDYSIEHALLPFSLGFFMPGFESSGFSIVAAGPFNFRYLHLVHDGPEQPERIYRLALTEEDIEEYEKRKEEEEQREKREIPRAELSGSLGWLIMLVLYAAYLPRRFSK